MNLSNSSLFLYSPVKVVCSIIGLNSAWVGLVSALIFLVIISANFKELTYFMVKVSTPFSLFVRVSAYD
jgi:hypothetical protein